MWSDLTMRQRAFLISQGVRAGIGSANTIKKLYNEQQRKQLDGGGFIDKQGNPLSWIDVAKAVIKSNEGWREFPYADGPGLRSVGWGFNDSGFRTKYKNGISSFYENGITKEQAERELNWYLGNAINDLKRTYGSLWDTFSDSQRVAILDSYYQQPASVLKKSKFFNAINHDRDNAYKYLGVNGYDQRNEIRRHYFTNTGEMSMNDERMARVSDALRYGEGMSYSLPSVDIKAPSKEVPEKQYNINLQPYSAVASLPPLLPPASTNRRRIEPPKEKDDTYATLQEEYNPYIFNNYWTPDMNKYSTFKYALESNKNIKENKQRMLRDEQEIYDLYNIKTHV